MLFVHRCALEILVPTHGVWQLVLGLCTKASFHLLHQSILHTPRYAGPQPHTRTVNTTRSVSLDARCYLEALCFLKGLQRELILSFDQRSHGVRTLVLKPCVWVFRPAVVFYTDLTELAACIYTQPPPLCPRVRPVASQPTRCNASRSRATHAAKGCRLS